MPPSRYHHGDLKSVLLALAEQEIEAVGHAALELKALAAKAGVTKAAPYRHFRSREDLLIALGARGFALLKAANEAAAETQGTPTDRLRAVCLALVDFSAAHPQLYRMMFDSDLMPRLYSPQTWGEVVRQAYEIFEHAMAATLPAAAPRALRAATLACHASVQGFILLRDSFRMDYLLIEGETEATLLDKILAPHLARPLLAPPTRHSA